MKEETETFEIFSVTSAPSCNPRAAKLLQALAGFRFAATRNVRLGSVLFLVLFLLLRFGSCSALAGESEKVALPSTPQGVTVVVRGQTTLDPYVIQEMTGAREKPEITQAEIRKRLESSGLFSYVQVVKLGKTIYVLVRQKEFTLFAFPYISSNYTGTYYSIAGGKQVVLGEDALIAGRYQFGTGDHEGGIIVRDEAILGSPFIAELTLGYQDALHWIYDGRNIVSSTENKFRGGGITLGYRFYPYLDCSLINYVEYHDFEELNGEFFSGLQWSTMIQIDYNHLYHQEGATSGFRVKWDYEQTPPLSGFQFWRTKISPTVAVFQGNPLNWVVRAEASYSPSLPRYQKAELGGEVLRGYEPEEFRVNYYGVIQNDFFLSSTDFWKINLRTLTFVDWGFVDGSGRTGTGAGVQIYPKNIAISAFQVYAGYGLNPPGWSVSVALGTTFQ